ncbi:unnamed protein product [Cyprideis torosa]|uniref:Uncharacterized protein n=1 Tax=Cyprideis torosa TaxID=163714 RepID=A0A7R8WT54_9CRUS|nr:unnamed protein product [Cyprideis torosa]CAG0904479.1 unnamed protein product [Cyprideis torosa]
MGLAGKNGAGKSTLLKILSQRQKPTYGQVIREGGARVGYLSQDLDFEDDTDLWSETKKAFGEMLKIESEIEQISKELETREDYESDAYMQLIEQLNEHTDRLSLWSGDQVDGEMEKVLLGLGFTPKDYNQPTSTFSGGWRMRIELAKLLLQKYDVLLLDEPTNHLDIDSILWLEQFLKQFQGALIMVSHDKMFLDKVCNRTIEIVNRKIEDYKTNYSNYLIQRKERREKLVQAQKNQEKQIKHTEQLIDKFRAKASKASTAKSLQKKLQRVDRIEVDNEDVSKMNIRFIESVRPGKEVVKIEDAVLAYDQRIILSNVNLSIARSKKIAFIGQNGQGKTTLAKAIVGVKKLQAGEVHLGHNVSLGYFAQNQAEIMKEDRTVLEEAEQGANEDTHRLVRDMLGSFLFSGDDVQKKVKVLSGGERNRLALCKLLLKPFNVLVLDEPTNHLDIQSKEILKQALLKFTGTVIMVSHDREFLDGLAELIYEFRDGKVKEFLGGIQDYLASREFSSLQALESSSLEKPKESKEPKKVNEEYNKEEKKALAQIEKVEAKISKLESEIKQMEEGFLEQNPSEDQIKAYEALKSELTEQMNQWEKLQEEIL